MLPPSLHIGGLLSALRCRSPALKTANIPAILLLFNGHFATSFAIETAVGILRVGWNLISYFLYLETDFI